MPFLIWENKVLKQNSWKGHTDLMTKLIMNPNKSKPLSHFQENTHFNETVNFNF